MRKFHVGQRVKWLRVLVPDHMKEGRVVRVIRPPELRDGLNEYDVRFRFQTVRLYEKELRSVRGQCES
jgi:hypothetical protein